MRIITHTCNSCGTIIAGNVLGEKRRLPCPRTGCDEVHTFEQLPATDQDYLSER